jgi:hypothetical protein
MVSHHGSLPLRLFISSSADLSHFRNDLAKLKFVSIEGYGGLITLNPNVTVVLGSNPQEYLRTIAKHIDAATLAFDASRPGARLSRFTQSCMSAESHRLIVWPAIMDMQVEYADARNAGRHIHALMVLIRGYAQVLRNWLYGVIAPVIRRIFSA